MVKTTSEITIIDNEVTLMLHNKKNKGLYTRNKEQNRISFNDSNGNKAFNYSVTISVNFKVFELTKIGETINFKDGTIIAYLSRKDLQELAEKTFYEDGQTRIYDFVNHKFILEL
jgi:Tfp pilus assembly protein FimT